GAGDTVHVRPITVGPTEGESAVVTQGLAPGEMVVVDGVDRLREGAVVQLLAPETQRGGTAPASGHPGGHGPHRGGPSRTRVVPVVKPSRPFILRPVATSLLMAAIFLAGVVAYRALSISALPQIDYPTIQVVTLYPGASPDVMTSSITAPLERQFGQMPGLN